MNLFYFLLGIETHRLATPLRRWQRVPYYRVWAPAADLRWDVRQAFVLHAGLCFERPLHGDARGVPVSRGACQEWRHLLFDVEYSFDR